jgi:NAD(P)H-dependent FMN reductase
MPLYDGDLEAEQGLPENAKKLKAMFKANDGLLISSPEYNSSFSPLLKNTLDWVSRTEGDEPSLAAYSGKVAALVSASPGRLGGLRGLVHVRSMLSNIDVLVIPDQEALGGAHKAFNVNGTMTDAERQADIEAVGARLAEVIAKLKS